MTVMEGLNSAGSEDGNSSVKCELFVTARGFDGDACNAINKWIAVIILALRIFCRHGGVMN